MGRKTMKKRILYLGLIGIVLLATGWSAMAANGAGRNRGDGPSWGKGRHCRMNVPRDHMARLIEKLDLTAEQQQEVDKLLAAHQEQAEKLRYQMVDARRKLHQAMNPKAFDEKALRQAAAEKNRLQTDLMVDRARTHSRIYALLTPEQQELADLARNLKRLRGDGPGRRFHDGPAPRFDCPNAMGPGSPRNTQ
jgi:protein CpxP